MANLIKSIMARSCAQGRKLAVTAAEVALCSCALLPGVGCISGGGSWVRGGGVGHVGATGVRCIGVWGNSWGASEVRCIGNRGAGGVRCILVGSEQLGCRE